MVREMQKNDQTIYICEECGFAYKEKEWAEKCQQWCQQNHSCNLEIIQHGGPLELSDDKIANDAGLRQHLKEKKG